MLVRIGKNWTYSSGDMSPVYNHVQSCHNSRRVNHINKESPPPKKEKRSPYKVTVKSVFKIFITRPAGAEPTLLEGKAKTLTIRRVDTRKRDIHYLRTNKP